jgi:hypothetical protein
MESARRYIEQDQDELAKTEIAKAVYVGAGALYYLLGQGSAEQAAHQAAQSASAIWPTAKALRLAYRRPRSWATADLPRRQASRMNDGGTAEHDNPRQPQTASCRRAWQRPWESVKVRVGPGNSRTRPLERIWGSR